MSRSHTRHLKYPVAEPGSAPRPRIRARRVNALLLAMLVLLPVALSPTHPIAVYGFLAAVSFSPLTSPVYAATDGGLAEFLVAPARVEAYRENLLDDLSDTGGGHLFAITCRQDGQLDLAPIRTWNSMLPDALPENLRAWLDRKEFPFLADEVALWLDGQRIIAMGHYHVYGGPPSRGDRLAQFMTSLPEIVVSNGVIPLVYLRSEMLPYGADVEITQEVFRALRTVESCLGMEVGEFTAFSQCPSPVLRSVLSYLRDHRYVDITQRRAVAREIENLCLRFKEEYTTVFQHGYTLAPYAHNTDHTRMLQNIAALHGWAFMYATAPDLNARVTK